MDATEIALWAGIGLTLLVGTGVLRTSEPPYNVTTEVLPGAMGNPQGHVEDFRQVIDAIRAGKDVEMNKGTRTGTPSAS